MFQMYPGALDAEMDRRHELATTAMRAVHATIADRRIAGVVRFRHAVAMIPIVRIAFAR